MRRNYHGGWNRKAMRAIKKGYYKKASYYSTRSGQRYLKRKGF